MLVAPPAGHTQTQDRARLEALLQRADERIRALQAEADALVGQERSLLGDLRRLDVDRQLKTTELSRIAADLERTTLELNDTTAGVTELEQEVSAQRPGIEARLVELYKLGRPGYLRLLLGVDDLGGFTRAYRTVAMLAALDRRRVDEYQATLASLRATQATLEERRDRTLSLQAEATRTRRALDQALAAQSDLVASIDARRDLTAQLTGELQLAHGRLQASLDALATGAPPESSPVALPLRPFQGELAWPLLDEASGVSDRSRAAAVRNGIEVSTQAGRPVGAVHGGQIAFAGPFTGFGHLVIVDHGAQAYSLYGYLSSIDVERGVDVSSGQRLGAVGRSPTGDAALYFELRIDGEPVNPLECLKR